MSENKNPYDNSWDDGVYGTGPTTPPKDHGGALAVLLVLVIFLSGVITILSILNIRMFQKLNEKEESDLAISFDMEETEATESTESPVTAPAGKSEELRIDLQDTLVLPGTDGKTDELSLQEIYVQNIPSVVSIACTGSRSTASGTGVIFSRQGYIVTNNHVVEGAEQIGIRLTDDRTFTASLVGSDPVSDLAVLYIEADDLIPAQFGDSDGLQVGDSVVAIGDPLGVEYRGTMTNGIISAINRDVTVKGRTLNLIQTNAALNSGNSGGPLINSCGQVIGINTMKVAAFTDNAGVEGLGFAIPSATVKDVVSQLIAQGYVSGRPMLGVEGEALSSFYQHFYRMPAGMYITHVDPGSPAALAGIEQGDILMRIDDCPVTDMDSMNAILFGHQVGDAVTILIFRNGYQAGTQVTLAEAKG